MSMEGFTLKELVAETRKDVKEMQKDLKTFASIVADIKHITDTLAHHDERIKYNRRKIDDHETIIAKATAYATILATGFTLVINKLW